MAKKLLSDWKVHVFVLIFVVVAEFIGIRPVVLFDGMMKFSLLPMLYVLVFGIILALLKVIPRESMTQASPCIGIATMWLISKLSTSIGPNLGAILEAGPALILQEFGNLGTIFFSVPIAIFVFKMGRQAVGAGFSNSREGSLALMGSMYGLDSPQGQGVMGAYITGTILGTIFCGILASAIIAIGIFHPYSLAMAAGTGSASMMAAGMGPVIDAYPEMAEQIQAYAGTSNLLSTVDGLYMSLFIGIPLTNWLYKVLKGDERFEAAEKQRAEKRAAKLAAKGEEVPEAVVLEAPSAPEKMTFAETWMFRGKILVLSGLFAIIANMINTSRAGNMVGFFQAVPGIFLMVIPVVLGCLVDDVVRSKKPDTNLPAILWISIIAIIMGLPAFPGSTVFIAQAGKIGTLPLCTPILAYAGVSIGKDLKSFKEQGLGIVVVALCAFFGTYIGSAIIAEVILRIQGII